MSTVSSDLALYSAQTLVVPLALDAKCAVFEIAVFRCLKRQARCSVLIGLDVCQASSAGRRLEAVYPAAPRPSGGAFILGISRHALPHAQYRRTASLFIAHPHAPRHTNLVLNHTTPLIFHIQANRCLCFTPGVPFCFSVLWTLLLFCLRARRQTNTVCEAARCSSTRSARCCTFSNNELINTDIIQCIPDKRGRVRQRERERWEIRT